MAFSTRSKCISNVSFHFFFLTLTDFLQTRGYPSSSFSCPPKMACQECHSMLPAWLCPSSVISLRLFPSALLQRRKLPFPSVGCPSPCCSPCQWLPCWDLCSSWSYRHMLLLQSLSRCGPVPQPQALDIWLMRQSPPPWCPHLAPASTSLTASLLVSVKVAHVHFWRCWTFTLK